MANKLSGGAGPCSVDTVSLKNYMLRFGKQSAELREEMAAWTEWLGNEQPP